MNAIVEQKPAQASFDLSPRNFDEAWRMADYLANSEMVPKQYRNKPGDCLVAMQWGNEIGLKALQALQSIAPINGKPNLYGDAGKALLLAHGCIIEEDDTEVVKTTGKGRCKITRPGRPPVQRTFSVEDAKTAGLWGKEGPWKTYPYRQMAWRAFWFAARDAAADLLRGMGGYEEGIDTPTERHMGPVDEVKPATTQALPDYSAADFTKNLPAWTKLVADGKKRPGDLLATLSTKATFSEEQKAVILSLKVKQQEEPPQEHTDTQSGQPTRDSFVDEMEAAERGVSQ